MDALLERRHIREADTVIGAALLLLGMRLGGRDSDLHATRAVDPE